MGNRAVIRTESDNAPAIYLHWNGGLESVLAFLGAAKELAFSDPVSDRTYGMGYLQAAIAIFFLDGRSTGVGLPKNLDCDNGDNGTYYLGKNWTIAKRAYVKPEESARIDVSALAADELEKMEKIKAMIVARWRAAMEVRG